MRACWNTDGANRCDAGTSPHPPQPSTPRSPRCSPRLCDWSRQSKGAIKQKLTQNTQLVVVLCFRREQPLWLRWCVMNREAGRQRPGALFHREDWRLLGFLIWLSGFRWLNWFLSNKHFWFHFFFLSVLVRREVYCIMNMNEVQYVKLAEGLKCQLECETGQI